MTARQLGHIALTMVLMVVPGRAPAGEVSASDWPQWRGPNRDGVAPSSPKLADAWPKDGPKLLWKSEAISGEADGGSVGNRGCVGGCGSVSVTGGRAFFFANCKYTKDKVAFTTQVLKDLGWVEGLTEELAKKIDKAYNFNLKGAALEKHIGDFLATLDPADASKFGGMIRANLAMNWEDRYSCGLLFKLSKMRDREFDSVEAWNHATGADLLHGHGEHAGQIRNELNARGSRYMDTAFCLDAATGQELWRKEFPGSAGADALNCSYGSSSTPTICNGKCYVAGSAGVYCLAVKDGATVWQAKSSFSNASPLVTSGAVFIATTDALCAFKAERGEALWSQPEVRNSSSSAILWNSGGKGCLLVNATVKGHHSDLVCAEPESGKVLWRIRCGGGSCYSTPAVCGDLAVVYGYGNIYGYRLTPQKAEMLWEGKFGGDRGASPVIYQDHVYIVGGAYGKPSARCLDLKTGEVNWEKSLDHSEVHSPTIADGKVFATIEGYGEKFPLRTILYKATPERFAELGSTSPMAGVLCLNASPAIADGKMFLRLKNLIACYDVTAAAYAGMKLVTDAPTAPTSQPKTAETAPLKPSDLRIAFPQPGAQAATGTVAPEEPAEWQKNWPQFRGPAGNGIAAADADPPIKLDLARDVAFRVDVPAKGQSSPIVWGDRVFLTGEGDRVMAFDRASGKLLWNTSLKTPPSNVQDDDSFKPQTKDTGIAAPTPCTDGKRVYAFFGDGILGCVDFEGQQVWSERLVQGKPRNIYGLAASPVLYGNLVIQVVDLGSTPEDKLSFIVAVRARDGIVVWGQERPVRSAWSTPLLCRGAKGDELITAAQPWVIAYQPSNGTELWRAGGVNGDVAASPVGANGVAYTSSGQGGSELLALKVGGKGDVTTSALAWSSEAPVPDAASLLCDGKRHFFISSSGELRCLDAATGKALWQKQLNGPHWASPVLARERLYVVSTGGELSVVQGADGQVLSTVKLPQGVTASPAFLGTQIFIRTAGLLFCLGRR
ncbi:MAG: PQQ-binding-like beta-propeller repeat protein [Planctomycetota bacterium]|nr:PQQ-binding-like beta-propeller repeat protein [Planctomycetota bacterium]